MTDRWISHGFGFGRRGWRQGGAGECEKTPLSLFTGFDLGVVLSSRGVEGWGCSVCGQQGFTYEVWTLIRDQLQPQPAAAQRLWERCGKKVRQKSWLVSRWFRGLNVKRVSEFVDIHDSFWYIMYVLITTDRYSNWFVRTNPDLFLYFLTKWLILLKFSWTHVGVLLAQTSFLFFIYYYI